MVSGLGFLYLIGLAERSLAERLGSSDLSGPPPSQSGKRQVLLARPDRALLSLGFRASFHIHDCSLCVRSVSSVVVQCRW